MPKRLESSDTLLKLGIDLQRITERISSIGLCDDLACERLDQLDRDLAEAERRIAAIPATSLSGAAVQLMLAYNLILIASASRPDPQRKAQMAALLKSATSCVARLADLDLQTVGGAFYAPDLQPSCA